MRNARGFTLIELIIGMVAGAIVAAIAVSLLAPARGWFFTKDRRSGLSEAEAAVTRVTKEIRRIKTPGDITTMTASQLTFTDYEDGAVTFQLSSGNLVRNGNVLARNVTSFAFTYLDENGNTTAVAADVRVIRVKLIATSGAQTIKLQSAERIRNLP